MLTKNAPNTGTITFGYDIITGVSAGFTGESQADGKGNTVTNVYDKLGRLSEVRDSMRVTAYSLQNTRGEKS